MILVIRHAVAGERAKWKGFPDEVRPLSGKGRKQALALVKQHRDRPITRLLSSPYDRCTQTLGPLAQARGLEIEVHPALEEGGSWKKLRKLLEEIGDEDVALCTHGDMLELLLDGLRDQGVKCSKKGDLKKGATWVLETKKGRVVRARYRPPPR